MDFKITDKVSDEDRSEIFQELLKYNLSKIEEKNPKDLGIYLETPNGRKIAGLVGETFGKWLTVKYLWVDESHRGTGIGSQLLMAAEKTAAERGCKYVFLDTFGFQAPQFYEKHGYQEVFVLQEYPVTGTRHYYTKRI